MSKLANETSVLEDRRYINEGKRRLNGIILVPQPTDDPRDPLNFPQWRKEAIFATITFAIFASTVSPLAGQLNLAEQAKLYHKTTTQESYSNSAAIAGLAAGPYLFPFLTLRMGKSSIIFWTVFCLLICQIWAPLMTGPNDYNGHILSRLFAGLFGSVVGVVGPRILVDIFFLHERGRRFAIIFTANVFGSVVGPTLSGFISARTSWPVEYWWTVGLLGIVLILCFIFLEETGFAREESCASWPKQPDSFIANRIATFFLGQRLQPSRAAGDTLQACINPFLILICPVTLLAGLFGLVNFGVYVAVNSLAPVFLQRSVKAGGYGYSVEQNAYFSFSHWVGILIVLIYTFVASDRLSLAICRRNGGIWKPEYRLYSLWLPSIFITPVGVGLYGACLAYHLNYMLIAFSVFLVTVGSFSCVPIIANYLVECFINFPMEAAMSSTFFRIVWGLTVPFYINEWVDAVGIGWCYGMMAFFSLGSFAFVLILMLKGHSIRQFSFTRVASSEDGEVIVDSR